MTSQADQIILAFINTPFKINVETLHVRNRIYYLVNITDARDFGYGNIECYFDENGQSISDPI